jgi:hypothetical protein
MNIEQNILNLKPREESGSKTARKYSFQKDLSLFLLLTLHEKKDDYVFLFDFHEDLVILDSSSKPDKMDFFQIKSKDSKNWTIGNLTKSEKNKLSILGKLYTNKLNFNENTNSLNFITNANFSFKQLTNKDDSLKKSIINASELDKDDFDKIENALKTEHKLKTEPDFKNITKFHVTKLSNKDSSTHCLGELNRLINKINPENQINAELAYKQVINEVKIRTENTVGDKSFTDIGELIEIKGISKKQFLTFLEKAGLYKSVEQEWEEIRSLLVNCGVGVIELFKYRKFWRDVTVTLIKDSNKIPLEQLRKQVQTSINDNITSGKITETNNLLEIINHCFSEISSNIYDDYFIKCLIIRELNEQEG